MQDLTKVSPGAGFKKILFKFLPRIIVFIKHELYMKSVMFMNMTGF